jgi:hypothetical protein
MAMNTLKRPIGVARMLKLWVDGFFNGQCADQCVDALICVNQSQSESTRIKR